MTSTRNDDVVSYTYDDKFLNYAARSSEYAARRIVPLLRKAAPVSSVLDVGCAGGTWLRVWRREGVTRIHGIDGGYVDRSALQIPESSFTAADLAAPVDLSCTFDLVQSFEVGEHIPLSASETFVDTITRHARGVVAFSAAVPGQGGEFHVNEQPLDFWRAHFLARGYQAFDYLRPHVLDDGRVPFWYRFNMLLFVREDRIGDLPEVIRATRIPDNVLVRGVSPLLFRARKVAVRLLPAQAQHLLARIKAHFAGRI